METMKSNSFAPAIQTGQQCLNNLAAQPFPSTPHPLFAAALDHPEGRENEILSMKAQIKVIFLLPTRTL